MTNVAESYEAIHADCHAGGFPAVAWTEITNNKWIIKVSMEDEGVFLGLRSDTVF